MKTLFSFLIPCTCVMLLLLVTQCQKQIAQQPPCSVEIVPPELNTDFMELQRQDIKVCTDQYGNPIESDNLIIHFYASTTDARIRTLQDSMKPDFIDSCLCDPRLQNWRWNASSSLNIEETVSQLSSQGKKEGDAMLNYIVNAFEPGPSENPTIDTSYFKGEYYTPNGKLIAILDSGLDTIYARENHLTLYTDDSGNCRSSSIRGWNFIAENSDISDDNGHGTAVTGVIAETLMRASMNNEYSCGARFMILKTLDRNGMGNMFDAICAFHYATRAGAEIINLSWGYYNVDNAYFRDSVLTLRNTSNENPVIVASMGNYGKEAVDVYRHFPSHYSDRFPYLISVAGDERAQIWDVVANIAATPATLSGFSNFLIPGPMITAPSRMVPVWGLTSVAGPHRRMADGTSYSAAYVSAAAAIALCCDGNLRNPHVRDSLNGPPVAAVSVGATNFSLRNIVLEQASLCPPALPPGR